MNNSKHIILTLASTVMFVAPMAMFGQNEGSFLIHHATNLATTDTVVNLSNSGSSLGTYTPLGGGYVQGNGNICVNIYVFSPDEQLQWCCMCTLSPNALGSFSLQTDGISNTLTGQRPSGVVVKLVSTILGAVSIAGGSGGSSGTLGPPGCDATAINAGGNTSTQNNMVGGGMVAWARDQISPLSTAGTESAFMNAQLSLSEVRMLNSQCLANKTNGSGHGFCKTPSFPGTQPLTCKPVGL
jgi:hypothetical protein